MIKPRRRTAVVLAALAALLVAGAFATRASASWYITQRQAEHDAEQVLHDRYGYALNRVQMDADCSPTGDHSGRYAPRHRWVCYWDHNDGVLDCDGFLIIRGSNHAAFRDVVWSAARATRYPTEEAGRLVATARSPGGVCGPRRNPHSAAPTPAPARC
jgi:hypothetical protein